MKAFSQYIELEFELFSPLIIYKLDHFVLCPVFRMEMHSSFESLKPPLLTHSRPDGSSIHLYWNNANILGTSQKADILGLPLLWSNSSHLWWCTLSYLVINVIRQICCVLGRYSLFILVSTHNFYPINAICQFGPGSLELYSMSCSCGTIGERIRQLEWYTTDKYLVLLYYAYVNKNQF